MTGAGAFFLMIRSSGNPFYIFYFLFVFIAIAQFLIATLGGGGEPDLTKHLFMFNLAFDVSFLLLILAGYRLLENQRLLYRRRASRLRS